MDSLASKETLLNCPAMSESLWPHALAARQASLPLTVSWSLPKLVSIASVMASSHLILWWPLLLPSTFPSIRDFPMSQLFTPGDQYTGASASASALPAALLSVSYLFVFLFSLWDSHGKYTGVVCRSLLLWITFFSELSTMTHPSLAALPGIAHGFIELHKPLRQNKAVIREGNIQVGLVIKYERKSKFWSFNFIPVP